MHFHRHVALVDPVPVLVTLYAYHFHILDQKNLPGYKPVVRDISDKSL